MSLERSTASTASPSGPTDSILRLLDVTLAAGGLVAASPIMLVCAALIRLDSPGPAIFAQPRVGRRRRVFTCYKFRTMRQGTPSRASHEVSVSAVTGIGGFLRKVKIDELPQLWNVLRGDMSLVGPRPCLETQEELVQARDALGVYALRPGITGVAQVQGVDMSEPQKLATLDATWIERRSVGWYIKLLVETVMGGGRGDRVQGS